MKLDIIELVLRKKGYIEIEADSEFAFGIESAAPIFISEIGSSNVERCALLCMDSTHKIINYSVVSVGSILNVDPAIDQIIRIALISNASYIIVGHNHPSGVLSVTSCDIETTKKLGAIAKYFNIHLVDSIIVNAEKALSIREEIAKNEW